MRPRAARASAPTRRVGSRLVVRTASLIVALLTATAIASRISDDAVAAHQICMQVLLFLALSLDALAIAGQAMVGRFLGASSAHDARAVGRRLIELGVVVGLLFGARGRGRAPVAGGRVHQRPRRAPPHPRGALDRRRAAAARRGRVRARRRAHRRGRRRLPRAGDAGGDGRRVPPGRAAGRRARRRPALALGRARAVDAGPLRGHGRPASAPPAGRSPARSHAP